MVPDEFLPSDVLAEVGGARRRRSSVDSIRELVIGQETIAIPRAVLSINSEKIGGGNL